MKGVVADCEFASYMVEEIAQKLLIYVVKWPVELPGKEIGTAGVWPLSFRGS